jgi:hypothetical protein
VGIQQLRDFAEQTGEDLTHLFICQMLVGKNKLVWMSFYFSIAWLILMEQKM